jgi:hypothetical protein
VIPTAEETAALSRNASKSPPPATTSLLLPIQNSADAATRRRIAKVETCLLAFAAI